MARPLKEGVDYFPLDTVLDTKFELLEAEFGLTAFAIVVKLFQRIYGERGYYCEWTREVALSFSHKIGEGCNVVSEIVSASIKRGIFSQEMYEKYSILTSKGIQERYLEVVSRRKNFRIKPEYLLVPYTQKSENVNNNSINVCNNSIIVDNNAIKESKVKESKGKYCVKRTHERNTKIHNFPERDYNFDEIGEALKRRANENTAN